MKKGLQSGGTDSGKLCSRENKGSQGILKQKPQVQLSFGASIQMKDVARLTGIG